MIAERTYCVLLLPRREVAARHLSHGEALAWMRGYNETVSNSREQREAVVAEESEFRSQRRVAGVESK